MNTRYEIKPAKNGRWGIYRQGKLLATIGSYEACQSIIKSLDKNAYPDLDPKARISYQQAIGRSLIV